MNTESHPIRTSQFQLSDSGRIIELRTDNLNIFYRESTNHYIILCPWPNTDAYFCTIIPDHEVIQTKDCMCEPKMSSGEADLIRRRATLSNINFDDLPKEVKIQYLAMRKAAQEESGLPLSSKASEKKQHLKPDQEPKGASSLSYAPHKKKGKTNGLAITSLVLGVLSFPTVICYGTGVIFGIIAFITGLIARSQIKETGDTQGGKGMALAGMITGGIISALAGIAVLVIIILALLGPSIGNVFSNIIQEIGTPVP